MPSATTTNVWKRLQGSRSSRAGMSVSTMAGCAPGASMRPDNVTAAPFVQQAGGLRGVLANQHRRRSDLVNVEWRGLVKLVDPVAEQQMGVAAPAVFRLAARIVLRKIMVWRRDWLAGRHVAKILIGKGARVVLDVIEHMQRAMRGIVQQAKSGLIGFHQDLEPASR